MTTKAVSASAAMRIMRPLCRGRAAQFGRAPSEGRSQLVESVRIGARRRARVAVQCRRERVELSARRRVALPGGPGLLGPIEGGADRAGATVRNRLAAGQLVDIRARDDRRIGPSEALLLLHVHFAGADERGRVDLI